eukprot:TRINITY_DN4190_c0_g1_i2.p2 TRINITY_DN4190_c0_g1~~TRINITY_DN4190_c0_g1_i2.p2  ORF type:complete len:164 (-),score=6.28 TRINITY_DN4190_c0_g1_i2:257-748(-)
MASTTTTPSPAAGTPISAAFPDSVKRTPKVYWAQSLKELFLTFEVPNASQLEAFVAPDGSTVAFGCAGSRIHEDALTFRLSQALLKSVNASALPAPPADTAAAGLAEGVPPVAPADYIRLAVRPISECRYLVTLPKVKAGKWSRPFKLPLKVRWVCQCSCGEF